MNADNRIAIAEATARLCAESSYARTLRAFVGNANFSSHAGEHIIAALNERHASTIADIRRVCGAQVETPQTLNVAEVQQAIANAEYERDVHFNVKNDTAANYQDGWVDALKWVLRQIGEENEA